MKPELAAIFKEYESFAKQVDGVWETVRKQFPESVQCKIGCSDCCHALFDITLVEALYINDKFITELPENRKNEILAIANKTDRNIYKLKRKAFKAVEAGEKTEEQVLFEMAAERSRCPLLNLNDRCDLYDYRPLTCRLYGIPTSIGGRGHTCGLSSFSEGQSYPTVNLDKVYSKLYDLSVDIINTLQSSHKEMSKILMPLSMALLTVFDDYYLGLKSEELKDSNQQKDLKNE
ncbi:YkgJ family cysteine cluster protein [Desulfosarcina ovata]|uniref:Zinc/iron-chelating domain-containing protein n=2 Tax=Desulfosarcina ovata TaxID=83564 RepID=A0A5K8ACY8_9BACT|nr:YkgJ family cysteine cluster protein [Desulfosarcina ovata]BBO84009.1 hypothetical protein DSCO28_45750 [Desulfosarcina ovata subsp. sediminis]BBO90485.1 hypothetical protein DSCOOX_36650 [Desulfosarcina ovata subsp. ovata]